MPGVDIFQRVTIGFNKIIIRCHKESFLKGKMNALSTIKSSVDAVYNNDNFGRNTGITTTSYSDLRHHESASL